MIVITISQDFSNRRKKKKTRFHRGWKVTDFCLRITQVKHDLKREIYSVKERSKEKVNLALSNDGLLAMSMDAY